MGLEHTESLHSQRWRRVKPYLFGSLALVGIGVVVSGNIYIDRSSKASLRQSLTQRATEHIPGFTGVEVTDYPVSGKAIEAGKAIVSFEDGTCAVKFEADYTGLLSANASDINWGKCPSSEDI